MLREGDGYANPVPRSRIVLRIAIPETHEGCGLDKDNSIRPLVIVEQSLFVSFC